MRIQHAISEAPSMAAVGTMPSVTDGMGKERELSEMAKTERLKGEDRLPVQQSETGKKPGRRAFRLWKTV